ncbi:PD-(D/E)XK nuclease family protein [Siphonobacter sp. SORGH_AS_1065]|uniref:PD-(D/E)XK nuclease family protein n=1 Tax=Siphonobacter sp. SORGH_AS_1065 TaxID=3041795 RepID=UPI00278AD487|nr:PD-(D/E)XK nuclease family protein [Siphonobacter sp. SORGH_AS_1065]MDQ1089153.1 hypothetical protein [Siphonobacter sp. SORGH_AS_1065]
MSFLSESADYIWKKYTPETISKISVVLPSRRAVYFFKQELAALSDRPFLAPEVMAMDDFVMERSGVQEIDPVALLFELYDTFKGIDPHLDFDRFTSWAPVVLRDFDQIDLYGCNAREVFRWVEAEKAIERWGTKDREFTDQVYTQNYFRLFENLLHVYEQLKVRLEQQDRAYRGMAYRKVAENVESIFIDNPSHDYYYFLGFNALSASEERILRKLSSLNRAEMLWDADAYYLKGHHEAGRFIRKYLADADLSRGEWNKRFRHYKSFPMAPELPAELLIKPKAFTEMGVPNATMQPKVTAYLMENWEQIEGNPVYRPHTAVVLGDENLLMPMLASIPEKYDDFNVTMGVSMRSSLLYSLVESLFELQRNVIEFRKKDGVGTVMVPKFSYKHIAKILHHPFIQNYWMQQEESFRPLLRTLKNENRLFVDEKELRELANDEPLVRTLFTRWDNDSKKATHALYALIDILRPLYDEKDAIETEYLYEFYTILKRLERLLAERKAPVSIKSYRRFLLELLRQTKIPFSGEPAAPLQVMGMLETRCLDFDRVIILSVNEGTLPTGKKQNSLIPFDAAQEFGLPTYMDADAVMSYHFFRLIQRAKEVVFLYTQPGGEGPKSEKSRFLLQLKHEWEESNSSQSKLKTQSIEFQAPQGEGAEVTQLLIHKTSRIQQEILKSLTERGVYATHLNMYYKCSLQYYFKRIAGVAEEEEVSEKLEANDFGVWVHEVLERIDREMLDRDVRIYQEMDYEQFIKQIPARLEAVFQDKFKGQVMDEGQNLLLYNIARRNLKNYFQMRIEELKSGMVVEMLAPEQKLTASFEYKGHQVLISGKIDRLERVNEQVRIVDYKTGKVEAKNLDVKANQDLEELHQQFLTNEDWEVLRQLWLYKYLVIKQNHKQIGDVALSASQMVQPGMISFRNLAEGFMAQEQLRFRADETPETFIEDSELILTQFMDELLNEATPFIQTENLKACEYCDYARICGRGV